MVCVCVFLFVYMGGGGVCVCVGVSVCTCVCVLACMSAFVSVCLISEMFIWCMMTKACVQDRPVNVQLMMFLEVTEVGHILLQTTFFVWIICHLYSVNSNPPKIAGII